MTKRNGCILFPTIALITGAISALLSSGNMDLYSKAITSPLSPPSFLFPVVWTVLYILMGISAAIIYNINNVWNHLLTIWAVQLGINFIWSLVFFNLEAYLFAFILLIILWFLIILMILMFNKQNKIAAYLQIPYLLWVTFAGYLTFSIYLLNR